MHTDPRLFYVSPRGNDEWPGSLPAPDADGSDGPLATLTRARDAVRDLKAAAAFDRPVTIMLLEGTHRLEQPLALDVRDSGTADKPVTWTAYPGHEPQLSGGIELTKLQPHQGPIQKCVLPRKWTFRQLFLDGKRQVPARWPKRDPDD